MGVKINVQKAASPFITNNGRVPHWNLRTFQLWALDQIYRTMRPFLWNRSLPYQCYPCNSRMHVMPGRSSRQLSGFTAGKTDNGFSSPAACVAPPAVWKLTRGKEQVYLQFHFSTPHNQAAHCLHQYSLPSGSGGKAKGMRIGRSYALILPFLYMP